MSEPHHVTDQDNHALFGQFTTETGQRPNLERNEDGVDNGSYDNDDSNFLAPTGNDTTYQGVCGHTSMQQGIFSSKNPHTAKIKLGPE